MLAERYGEFASAAVGPCGFELDVHLVPVGPISDADDISVRRGSGGWVMERGDFRAEWDAELRHGWVRQSANPYAIDGVLRILHTLLLAREGGFLVHAASAIRDGRAYLFAGVSGAGKTTMARLAPPDVKLLTDEISYVRRAGDPGSGAAGEAPENRSQGVAGMGQETITNLRAQAADSLSLNSAFPISSPVALPPDAGSPAPVFVAFGTPFAGELARIGENLRAPVGALYLLVQGPQNQIDAVTGAEAAQGLLRNILFFAQDDELVRMVFESVLEFVSCVPVRRLTFVPDERVWELIR